MRVVLPVLLLVALAAALIARAGSASSPVAFRTPDAGAACRARGEAIVCSTLASRQSARLLANGGAELVQRLPWWDASTSVLRRWRHGTLTCTLVRSALICGNGRTSIRVAADGLAVAG